MALNYACYFSTPSELLVSVVDFVLAEQMVDGEFNCERNRFGTAPRCTRRSQFWRGFWSMCARGMPIATELEQAAAQGARVHPAAPAVQVQPDRRRSIPLFVLSYPLMVLRHSTGVGLLQSTGPATIPGCRMLWMCSRQNVARMAPGRCRPNILAGRVDGNPWPAWPLEYLAGGAGVADIQSTMDEGDDDDLRLHKRKIRTPMSDVKQQIKASAHAKERSS